MSRALCPQQYGVDGMRVKTCTRCTSGWNRKVSACEIATGAEYLPLAPDVPDCPIQDRCQYQIQAGSVPCAVRARGMICESALMEGGLSPNEAFDHPLGFSAETVISADELSMEFS